MQNTNITLSRSTPAQLQRWQSKQAVYNSINWVSLQEKWKTKRAFDQIKGHTSLDLIRLAARNLQRLKREITPSADARENNFIEVVCQCSFSFSHAARRENTPSIIKTSVINSLYEFERVRTRPPEKGLTANGDRSFGNIGFAFAALRMENQGPLNVIGDGSDVLHFKMDALPHLKKKSYCVRASDWFWYLTERELEPVALGNVLRRVVHSRDPFTRKYCKTYFYEDPSGDQKTFTVKMGDEEFVGESFKRGFALMMLKELKYGDPAFREKVINSFTSTIPLEEKKKVATELFQLLYSPEISIPIKLDFTPQSYVLKRHLYKEVKISDQLHACALKGDLNHLKQLLPAHNHLIDARNYDHFERSLLMEAAALGHTEMVKYLIQEGANCNFGDFQKMTPLMLASINGHADVVKLLLEAGANPNSIMSINKADDNKGRWTSYQTALTLARSEHVQQLLIQHGARMRNYSVVVSVVSFVLRQERFFLMGKKCYQDQTYRSILKPHGNYVFPGCVIEPAVVRPEEAAIRNIKYMLNFDLTGKVTSKVFHHYDQPSANPGVRNRFTIVHLDMGVVPSRPSYSLSSGHLVDLGWFTVQDRELQSSNLTIMRSINSTPPEELDQQLSIELKGSELLHQAVYKNDLDEVRRLHREGVDIEARLECYAEGIFQGKFSTLELAIFYHRTNIVDALLALGAKSTNGNPMDIALKRKNAKIIATLSPWCCHLNFKSVVDSLGNSEIDRYIPILQNGKDLNLNDVYTYEFFVRDQNRRLLNEIPQRQRTNQLAYMLNRAIDLGDEDFALFIVSLLDEYKPTYSANFFSEKLLPLNFAASKNLTRVCEALIQKGAAFNCLPDSKNKTPQDYAKKHNNEKLLKLLEEHSFEYLLKKRGYFPSNFAPCEVQFDDSDKAFELYEDLVKNGFAVNPFKEHCFLSLENWKDFLQGKQGDFKPRPKVDSELSEKLAAKFPLKPKTIEYSYMVTHYIFTFESDPRGMEWPESAQFFKGNMVMVSTSDLRLEAPRMPQIQTINDLISLNPKLLLSMLRI